ncbi:S1C family serine protease [Desulfitibacter alkalitolerans]|uniref:S1C family serine protease n=1 Tax=Desulfitibacter alkalitolerans TaxID=264641 RepID=UPI0006861E3F|nr:serine protease [Desulfitibacter alkalitolerans]
MDKDTQYWKVALDKNAAEQVDTELVEELNEYYGDEEEADDEKESAFRALVIKLIGLVTACIFILLILANWFKVFSLPPIDFLAKSRELAKNPEFRELRESVVVVNAMGRQGTGFNISPTGVIITNHHVIRDSRIVYVNFIDGDIYHVKEIESFPEIDIAILKVEGENIPIIELETESNPQAGDEILIIGNPLGFTRIINKGQITGTTSLKGWDREVLMIEGAIHKGSSGSPVFNTEGKVVAVVFATLRSALDNDKAIGLAVPIKHLLEKLPAD